MAEQAHFAKYKISLKNNNLASQQVNKSTGQRANKSSRQRGNEDMRGGRKSKIRNNDSSKIREFENSEGWIDKKGGEIFEISPPYSYSITSFYSLVSF